MIGKGGKVMWNSAVKNNPCARLWSINLTVVPPTTLSVLKEEEEKKARDPTTAPIRRPAIPGLNYKVPNFSDFVVVAVVFVSGGFCWFCCPCFYNVFIMLIELAFCCPYKFITDKPN